MARRSPSPLRQRLQQGTVILLAICFLAYPLDWVVWRLRVAAGGGMGAVPVTETMAATLKGNHFEVYSQQSTTVSCSRSLLPEAGAGPCWWLRRYPERVVQY